MGPGAVAPTHPHPFVADGLDLPGGEDHAFHRTNAEFQADEAISDLGLNDDPVGRERLEAAGQMRQHGDQSAKENLENQA
jgi:hypothetical protein